MEDKSDLGGQNCGHCKASRRGRSRRWLSKLKANLSPRVVGKRKAVRNNVLLFIVFVIIVGGIIALVWFSLVLALIHRLSPSTPSNGLQRIVQSWKTPSDSISLLSPWPHDFSQGIVPVSCHSHNDYWLSVPLFEAIAAGCTGVEADVWLRENKTLLVGHGESSLTSDRTLQSLYIEPLSTILLNLNGNSSSNDVTSPVGIFDIDTTVTLTLLIDIKSDAITTWPVILDQLSPLISGGWVSHWNGTTRKLVHGPITVVGTGNTLFQQVTAEHDRYVFFDAPLHEISQNSSYSSENSYYASVSVKKAVGMVWTWGPTQSQKRTMQEMIDAATERGLVSRFWSIPSWPVNLRMQMWQFLVESRVGMLNVDNVVEATRWNWDWCTVAGLVLC
ncbi:altered inheritance of mitochondria protein 6 [Penicillium diatomitis]|uniref:Altered inheritance of mitochondria protein 6 n=1 Tax=Penicillium diatomitis TaxID=2819901 RepID=A0A9X0BYG1_9EURO|nr:altered inheritance of mitochondria protein 6 [Penicillium diatomitis]KAJ5489760.1 altered inheritance of mitochondria protein 6 [Penicillium diatomitis]